MSSYEEILKEAYRILEMRHKDEFESILTGVINDVKRKGGITR